MITILFIGDVVGEPGRTAVKHMLPELKREHGADFIIVNGENAAAGRGITPRLAQELLHAGVDVITTGDHVWDQAELAPWMESEPRVLRPVNYPQGTGSGALIHSAAAGKPLPHLGSGSQKTQGRKRRAGYLCGHARGNDQ